MEDVWQRVNRQMTGLVRFLSFFERGKERGRERKRKRKREREGGREKEVRTINL